MERYSAFLSYSQAADTVLAARLRGALHSFAKPWYRLRAIRVFLDKTSLSTAPALWPAIERALLSSEFFVLLASPDAASSSWVKKELETFVSKFGSHRVLLVVTDGELYWNSETVDFDWSRTTAIPHFNAPLFASEPLWVDLRRLRHTGAVSLRDPDFRDAVARLSAALRQLPADQLIGEDIRQHQRTLRVVRVASAAFAAVILALFVAGFSWYRKQAEALESHKQALESKNQALKSAAEALAAMARARAEMVVSWAATLEDRAPVSAALVLSELDEQHQPDRALALARTLANELPLRMLVGSRPLMSEDESRVLTFANDGRARVTVVPELRRTLTLLSDARVMDAALSADGRCVVLACDDGSLALWELAEKPILLASRNGYDPAYAVTEKGTSTAISRDGSVFAFIRRNMAIVARADHARADVELRGHGDAVLSVSLSADARYVATTSLDRSTRVWRVSDGAQVAVHLTTRSHPITAQFSVDGDRLLTQADNGVIRVWQSVLEAPAIELNATDYTPTGARLTPDGSIAVSGSKEGSLLFWDLNAPSSRPHVLRGHTDRVGVVALGSDGRLASASSDGTVRIWATRERLGSVYKIANAPVSALAVAAKHGLFFASELDDSTSVWSLRGDAGEARVLRTNGPVRSVAFSHDGRRLATGGTDGAVRVWDVESGQQDTELRAHSESVTSVRFSPDDGQILSISWDGSARVSEVATGLELRRFVCSTGKVDEANYDPTGTHVVTACGNAVIWDLHSSAKVELEDATKTSRHASFNPNGTRVLVSSLRSAHLWSVDGTRSPREFAGEQGEAIGAAKFSPDGRRVAVHSGNVAKVWQLDSDDEPLLIPGPMNLSDVQFSPDGQKLLIQSMGPTYLWDPAGTGEPLRFDDTWSVVKPRFTSDGRYFVSVGSSNHARDALVWDAAHSGPFLRLSGHDALLDAVDVHPSGRSFATASDDGTVRLWSIDWNVLRDFVRHRVRALGACLTASQRVQFLGDAAEQAYRNAKACEENAGAARGSATDLPPIPSSSRSRNLSPGVALLLGDDFNEFPARSRTR